MDVVDLVDDVDDVDETWTSTEVHLVHNVHQLFADTELPEDLRKHVLARDGTGQERKRVSAAVEIHKDHLLFEPCSTEQ